MFSKFSLTSFRTVDVRKDRQPLDTSKHVHSLLDAYFQKRFGVKVRSEGLFTTGSKSGAALYGMPNYVFPVGEFKFIWGTYEGRGINDTISLTKQIERMLQLRKRADAASVTQEMLDQVDWHEDDLPDAIKSSAEIAILVDKVILVPAVSIKDGVSYKKVIDG